MANKAMNDAWEPLLERYLAHAARYYKAVGKPIKIPGATPGQLAFLQSQSKQYGLVIDPSIERLLARVNGAGYDGVFLYGIQIPEHGDLYGRIDMVYMNRLIEERGPDTLYGQWTDEFLVRVSATGTFERRSIAGWDPYAEYDTCDQMLAGLLEEVVGYLDEHHGPPLLLVQGGLAGDN